MKQFVKKILGEQFCHKISLTIKYIRGLKKVVTKRTLVVNSDKVEKIEEYSLKDKHVFCGYYDLVPIKDQKMLVHVLDKKGKTNVREIELGYFDMNDNKYVKITNTKAWCWQQGSRLRWSNKSKNIIYYNDIEGEHDCFREYDLEKNQIVQTIPYALYDIDPEEKCGIAINFSRLQRLRPGYGYSYLKDNTMGQNAPKDDGIFVVDLKTGTRKMLLSLYDLAKLTDDELKYEHYINHIAFSPDGSKILFFHLWTEQNQSTWKNELCVINIDGTNLKILENEYRVSHYDWKDNMELLITVIEKPGEKEFYCYYNVETGEKVRIENKNLKQDRHPVHAKNSKIFYSDTYPDENCMQQLFEYDTERNEYTLLVSVFSNLRLNDEKRCDLHPKLVKDANQILIDTTYKGCKRSVLIANLKDEIKK